jgi:hypothetical protein
MSQKFKISPDSQGKLTLKRPGEEDMKDIRLKRSFPWTKPTQFVSVRSSEGNEILMIEDVAQLDETQRQLVTDYLSDAVFIPKITHIDAVDVRFGYQQWKVQTDRGPIEFRVQEREDIRFLPDGRFNVRDADGNVYELPPLTTLDEESRGALAPLV